MGIIPDGNRRWALQKGLNKEDGYERGISPGMSLFHTCQKLGIKEMSFYGFTADNTKRPSVQRLAFYKSMRCRRKGTFGGKRKSSGGRQYGFRDVS